MRIFSTTIFILIAHFTFGQAEIFTAIGNSDAQTLSQSFANDIEICIGTDQDFYSKAGAVKKLDAFFSKVKPKDSKFKHKGSNKDKTSEYSVGSMNTESGTYRVFIYYEGSKVSGIHFNKA
ncbi:DUF4783 domain-containing protein [Portibacter marinus]|uniref:DUF4783 domain-containing protein n=1 Tax=Portibacter marinus TaxID=2898660 RepID=UPI001F2F8776|nr:DUF4783 domain-containing protein [Portibacter marinus]